MKEVNKEELTSILGSNESVVVYFGAAWCAPCKVLHPMLVNIQDNYPNVVFVKVSADDNQELVQEYGVRNLPTLFTVKNGTQTARTTGALPEARLTEWLNENT